MAYFPAYTRTARSAVLVEGSGKAADALHDVIYSMGAITYMMRALLEDGEDQRHVSEHVWHLLDQQTCLLAGVYEELEAEEKARNEAAGVVKQTRIPSEALLEPAHKLRVQFIESNAKAGVDHALIGLALNVPGDEIDRVVARLRGEAVPRAKAARA